MIIQVRFGSAQTNVGYQFYGADGVLLGNRETTGIAALPETGSYIADVSVVPTGAWGVYWDTDTSEASEDLREAQNIESIFGQIAELPTVDEIIGAAGGLTSETVAALEAADQIFLAAPYVPDESPVLVIPAPDGDESLSVVYIYTESITNEKRAGIVLKFDLATKPAKSERVLETTQKTAKTNSNGYASITLQRGLDYLVTSSVLGLEKVPFTPTTETFDLLTLIS